MKAHNVMVHVSYATLHGDARFWTLYLECGHRVVRPVERPIGIGPFLISVPQKSAKCEDCSRHRHRVVH